MIHVAPYRHASGHRTRDNGVVSLDVCSAKLAILRLRSVAQGRNIAHAMEGIRRTSEANPIYSFYRPLALTTEGH